MRSRFPAARRPLAALLAAFIALAPLEPAWAQLARPVFPVGAPSGLGVPGAELGLPQRFGGEDQDLLQGFLSLPPLQGLSYLNALASDFQVPATQERRAHARALLSLLARPEAGAGDSA